MNESLRHEVADFAGLGLEVEAGDDLAAATRHRLDVLVDVGDRQRHGDPGAIGVSSKT